MNEKTCSECKTSFSGECYLCRDKRRFTENLKAYRENYRTYSTLSHDIYIQFIEWANFEYPRMNINDFLVSRKLSHYLFYFAMDCIPDYWGNVSKNIEMLLNLIETFSHENAIIVSYGWSGSKVYIPNICRNIPALESMSKTINDATNRIKDPYGHFSYERPYVYYLRPTCYVTDLEESADDEQQKLLRDELHKRRELEARNKRIAKRVEKRLKMNKFYKDGHTRSEIVKLIEGSHTNFEWLAVLDYYDNQCVCCGDSENVHKDHVIPVTWKGSSDSYSNLQPLCRSCNSKKGNRSDKDFRPYPLPSTSRELLEWYNNKAS